MFLIQNTDKCKLDFEILVRDCKKCDHNDFT